MLGPSGIQPHSSLSHERRCLYCQQRGCQGIQNCWQPRIRSFATKSCRRAVNILPHKDEGNSNKISAQGSPASAMEENLRTQIRVLEREVQLLRSGLCDITSVYHRGKRDVALMTSDLHLSDGDIPCISHGQNDKNIIPGAPSPSCINVPPLVKGNVLCQPLPVHEGMSNVNLHSQNTPNFTMTAIDDFSSAQPLREFPGTKRVEELEHLVRGLTAENVTLCRKLAEMKIVVEQRDALLQSIILEKLAPDAIPTPATAPTSTVSLSSEQNIALTTQLLRAQEEIAHFREETRQMKDTLKLCAERLKYSTTDTEGPQRQVQPRGIIKDMERVDHKTTTATTSSLESHTGVASSETAVASTPQIQAKEPHATEIADVAPSQGQAITTDATLIMTEVQNLQERLLASERKVFAWETWYSQQLQEPTSKAPPQQSQELTAVSRKEGDYPVAKSALQRMPRTIVRALPVEMRGSYANKLDVLPWKNENVVDALTIDTYAFMAKEAALREIAEQERADLMTALLTVGKHADNIGQHEGTSEAWIG